MYDIECIGCQHDDGDESRETVKHCFFWGIAVEEVSDWECTFAKNKEQGNKTYIPVK